MMFDWSGHRQELMETIGKIARLSPETVRGYTTLSAAGTKTNHLDAKTRELIALAVAVSLRCDGCITVHTDAAIKETRVERRNRRSPRCCGLRKRRGRVGVLRARDGCL